MAQEMPLVIMWNCFRCLTEANERGVVIVNCTQCLRGNVDMDDYATGHALKVAGVVNGYDMTTETAVAKLYYLLSQDWSVERVKRLMVSDLRGELTRPQYTSTSERTVSSYEFP